MRRFEPLRRSLGEVFLLVGGILLAFWIDAWWERRQQAQVEAGLVSAVALEVSDNQASLDGILSILENGRSQHLRFLNASPDELGDVEADSVGEWLFAMSIPWTYDPNLAATSALLQTPPLDSDLDLALRTLLGRWVRGVEDSREEGAIAMELGQAVARQILERAAAEGDLDSESERSIFGSIGPAGLAELRADREFVAANMDFWMWQAVYAVEIASAGEILDSIAAMLAER